MFGQVKTSEKRMIDGWSGVGLSENMRKEEEADQC